MKNEFTNENEAKYFLLNIYKEWASSLPDDDKKFLHSFQGSGKNFSADERSIKCINAAERAFKTVPGLPEDIILFRAARRMDHKDGFLYASPIRSIVEERFVTKDRVCRTIIAKKGSKIIPMVIFNDSLTDPELEVLLLAKNIRKKPLRNEFLYQNFR